MNEKKFHNYQQPHPNIHLTPPHPPTLKEIFKKEEMR